MTNALNDTRNILLAWASAASSVFAAVETGTWISIVSAIVLPVAFFALGKAVDVMLQVYFEKRRKR